MTSTLTKNSLYECLNETFPSFKQIQRVLSEVEPLDISRYIDQDPNSVFTFDYYFRMFQPEVGGRIINHNDFSVINLVELFNCQLIQFYLKHPREDAQSLQIENLLGSYWSKLEKSRLLNLFQELIATGNNIGVAAYLLLKNLDHDDLHVIENLRAREVLEFFKKSRKDFKKFLLNNLDLFDFIHKLARDHNDHEYLDFLNQHTAYAITLRLAENYSEEAEGLLDENGKIPLKELVCLINEIPNDSVELTLEIMVNRGLISPGIMNGIMRFKKY